MGQLIQKKKMTETKEVKEKTDSAQKASFYRSKKDRAEEVKKQNLIKKTEAKIEEIELEIAKLEEEISSSEIATDYELLNEKCTKLDNLKNELSSLYDYWEEISQ